MPLKANILLKGPCFAQRDSKEFMLSEGQITTSPPLGIKIPSSSLPFTLAKASLPTPVMLPPQSSGSGKWGASLGSSGG